MKGCTVRVHVYQDHRICPYYFSDQMYQEVRAFTHDVSYETIMRFVILGRRCWSLEALRRHHIKSALQADNRMTGEHWLLFQGFHQDLSLSWDTSVCHVISLRSACPRERICLVVLDEEQSSLLLEDEILPSELPYSIHSSRTSVIILSIQLSLQFLEPISNISIKFTSSSIPSRSAEFISICQDLLHMTFDVRNRSLRSSSNMSLLTCSMLSALLLHFRSLNPKFEEAFCDSLCENGLRS